MTEKNNLYIIGIIGVAAIIGIAMMIMTISNQSVNSSTASNDDTFGDTMAGTDSSTTIDHLSCSDSDGGENWYVKGVVIGPDKYGGGHFGADYCDSSEDPNGLMEGYCDAGFVNFKLYSCPNGCSDGACIPVETPTCTESDGGINYYVRGTITGNDIHGNGNPGVDYCAYGLKTTLMEGFCDSGYANFIAYDCPNGCKDGACI